MDHFFFYDLFNQHQDYTSNSPEAPFDCKRNTLKYNLIFLFSYFAQFTRSLYFKINIYDPLF